MNKRQIEIEKSKLEAEEKELRHLKAVYKMAAEDISKKLRIHNGKINVLLSEIDNLDEVQKSILQSQIYQKGFQESLKKQIDGFLSDLNEKQYKSIDEYLNDAYNTGFTGTMYDLHGQGIPLVIPINQKAVVKAIKINSKISKSLYTKLGEDVDLLKKRIANNISRGIATAQNYAQMAQNIALNTNVGFNRSMRIVRTEGHRVQASSGFDAQKAAKKKGADVVKQWDATLDGRTRKTHRKLDGQIRELEDPFEVDGKKAMHPGDFGRPEEDINCRCVSLQRARWALDENELETLKERAKYHGLDKTDDFEDFKKKYLKAAEETAEENTPKSIEEINKKGNALVRNIYEKHRKRNNLNLVPLEELDDVSSIMNARYGKMSVESANIFHNTIENLSRKYDTSVQVIRPMNQEEFLFLNNAFASVYHDYSMGSATLVFNTSKLKSVEKLTERISELGENRYSVRVKKGLEAQYVATHEFAHTLINLEQKLSDKTNFAGTDYKKIKKARKEVKALYDEYLSDLEKAESLMKDYEDKMFSIMMEGKEDSEMEKLFNDAYDAYDKLKVSDYSLENADEFMAECFTDAKIGENPSEYSLKLVEILDRYYGV